MGLVARIRLVQGIAKMRSTVPHHLDKGQLTCTAHRAASGDKDNECGNPNHGDDYGDEECVHGSTIDSEAQPLLDPYQGSSSYGIPNVMASITPSHRAI